MKKLFALLLVAVLLLIAVPAFAASASIRKIEYEGSGKVEVEFKKDVQYKSTKVKVWDEDGKSYSVKLLEKDNDSVEVCISGLKKGVRYGVRVSGVRSEGASSYTYASKTFRA